MRERRPRKIRVGRVVSDKMDKTVVVAIERRIRHRLYHKSIRRIDKFKAHDGANAYRIGDQVRIVEGRGLFDAGGEGRPICLGRAVARHLDKDVGATLTLGNDVFEVVGIFESATPLLESGGLLAFGDAQRVAGLEGKMSSALVQLQPFSPEILTRAETALEAAFPAVEATAPSAFSHAFDEFDLAEQAVTVFTILAIFVGGSGS